MDGHTLLGSKSPSAPRPDFELFFAVPAEHHEGITEEDWDAEMKRMFQHSIQTRQFLDGKISPQDYEDCLADLGHDPHALGEFWENGGSFGL